MLYPISASAKMNARNGRPRVPMPLMPPIPLIPEPCAAGVVSATNMYSIAPAWMRCGAQCPPASARAPLTRASRATR